MPKNTRSPRKTAPRQAAPFPVIQAAETSITAFIGSMLTGPEQTPVPIFSFQDYERIFGGLATTSAVSYAVWLYFLNGGQRALVVRTGDADLPGRRADRSGLYALEAADSFQLLCLPRFPTARDVPLRVLSAALTYCQERRALLLLDPRTKWQTPAQARTGLPALTAALGGESRLRNAALYFPPIIVADPLRSQAPLALAPCGAVAGRFAATDMQQGVWKSPAGAGAKLAGVSDLRLRLSEQSATTLNSLGVNSLRQFPGQRPLIWGARTLAGRDGLASEWKYVAIRRLGLFLEESLQRGTQWANFEPNAEPLWSRIRDSAGAFLDTLFRQGAFQGNKPQDAWFVKCDRTTMTQDDIDHGRLNIQVGFAPVKPAEFVIFWIRQATA